ncbi:MAG: MMPL family transporter [Planctomycetes bacterium]|nr:MMPL family transporter [Planctomycetota bacterium]
MAWLRFDNTAQAWLPGSDAALDTYAEFRERFGEDTFLLAASEHVDLGDPETVTALDVLAQRLLQVPGVARVHSPLDLRDPVEVGREELPVQLERLELARIRAPRDPSLHLLVAEANAAAAFLLHADDPDRALVLYGNARQAALVAFAAVGPPALLREGPAGSQSLSERLDALGRPAIPAVYWWAFARAGEIRASGFAPGQVASLPRVDEAMSWVLGLAPEFHRAGPHLYFALRYASTPRALGGDPETSREHWGAVRRLTAGQALMPLVLEAETFVPTLAATPAGSSVAKVLEAQETAYRIFDASLREVLLAQHDDAPDLRLPNAVARARARALLEDPSLAGIVVPRDLKHAPPPPVTRHSVLRDDPLSRRLVSAAHDRVGLLIVPRPGLGAEERGAMVSGIREACARDTLQLGGFHLAGPDAITDALDRGSASSFGSLFPLVALVMGLVVYGGLGSARPVLAVVAAAGFASVTTLGLLVAVGRPLNLILVVLPAILAVLTTAYALHLVSRYLDQPTGNGPLDGPARRALWVRAAKETFMPCLLTAATTAIGFGSLVTSSIPPVRDLGAFAAIGAGVCFAGTFVLVPTLLGCMPGFVPRPPTASWWNAVRAHALRVYLGRQGVLVILAGVALGIGGTVGLMQLQVESHILNFFPPTHELPRASAAIEGSLVGLTPLELWVSAPQELLLSAEGLEGLDGLVAYARSERELVQSVSSALEVLPADVSPEARAALLGAILARPPPGLEHSGMLHQGLAHLRITVHAYTRSSESCDALVQDVRAALAHPPEGVPPLPEGVRVRLTGGVPLLVRVQVLLLETQLQSFVLALVLVTFVLGVAFRSLTLVVVSLVPNLLPILVTLGFMGLLEIPLNTATVTVAGIALGLVVDDTIHLLHAYASRRGAGASIAQATEGMLLHVGRPVLVTSVAVGAGFGVFAFSPFRPTLFFGLLIAVTAFTALLCDLGLLPALLLRLPGASAGEEPGEAPEPADHAAKSPAPPEAPAG